MDKKSILSNIGFLCKDLGRKTMPDFFIKEIGKETELYDGFCIGYVPICQWKWVIKYLNSSPKHFSLHNIELKSGVSHTASLL